MGRIPDELIEEIRSANDIVDVISERIQVKKAGRNYRALCPFHQEKSPSFNINPERQIYHCFGCGAGGNVITFLMEHDKLSFLDAIRELADRAGIRLPERSGGIEGGGQDDPVYSANAAAQRYFRSSLLSSAGKEALTYVRDRGVSEETSETFGLGYAPPGWDGLLRAARKDGLSDRLLEEAGLAIARESGGHYDRFRDRVTFPLSVSAGRIVGFGGRAMGDAEPKYLNSPETRVYQKGRYLYGLREARRAMRGAREVILVEGYMDVLSLYQSGFTNVVASSGTALTREQAKTISRYADKVFIAYDGDAAGVAAATRAAEELVRFGLKVRVVSFPEEADPDSLLREKGPDALREGLASARDFIDFLVDRTPADTPEERESAARRLLSIVARVEDPIVADLMLEKIADALSIRRAAVTRAFAAMSADGAKRRRAERLRGRDDAPVIEEAELSAQKGLLSLVVAGGAVARAVREAVTPEIFSDPTARSLAERLWEADDVDVAALLSSLDDPEEIGLISELAVLSSDVSDGARLRDDYVRTIERSRIRTRIHTIDRAIETAEMTNSDDELLSLAEERQRLAERLQELAAGD